jgi:hypothetical protein
VKYKKKKIEAGKYEYRNHVIENLGYFPAYESVLWKTDLFSKNDFIMEKTLGEVMSKLDGYLTDPVKV